MNVFNLFPTALGLYEFPRPFSDTEMAFILGQDRRSNMGNTTSTDHNILDHPDLNWVREFVQNAVDEYYATILAPRNDTRLRITQSWCNYTEPGQFHHKHAHPNSLISGVLYPQADRDTDRIYFYRDGYQQLRTPTESFNPYNSESWWMEAYTGRMFIFPSNLTHMVETVEGRQTRISLSFNTFPVGDFGADDSLTGLHL